ncbi:MAG: hypothetical protein IT538_13545, partial [Variibacter sp.]|nr:hypothetical protein [Variibacter sp.]
VVAARFPSQAEMLVVLPEAGDAAKADKDGGCVREHWPYIADECLTRTDGGKAKPPTRTITIERKVASNVSELVRMPVSQVASR